MSGRSVLAVKAATTTAHTESNIRLSLAEMKVNILQAGVLDLVLDMSLTGKSVTIDPVTHEKVLGADLDETTRLKYLTLLTNKLLANAKEQKTNEDSPNKKWIEKLDALQEESDRIFDNPVDPLEESRRNQALLDNYSKDIVID